MSLIQLHCHGDALEHIQKGIDRLSAYRLPGKVSWPGTDEVILECLAQNIKVCDQLIGLWSCEVILTFVTLAAQTTPATNAMSATNHFRCCLSLWQLSSILLIYSNSERLPW